MSRRRRNEPAGPFELTVEDLAADARGVGRDADGKAVFVADTLPGERVRYHRTRRRRHHDEGVLDEVLIPAAERVAPRCPHFGLCGGCALQHLEPEAQVAFKQGQLLSTLERVGGVTPESVLPPVTGRRWEYRRRARLGVKHVPKKGGALVGFRERGTPFVAVLTGCEVLIPEVGRRLAELQGLIDSLSIRDRIPQIEVAGGDETVALVLRVLSEPSAEDRERLAAYSRESGLWFHLQPGGLDTVAPLLADTPELTYALPEFDVRLAFRPTDFVQIHAEVNAGMVGRAAALLDPAPGERVLELFAGLGNFSLPLARRGARVTAVEGDADLVARARANAAANGLAEEVRAYDADLFQPDPDTAWLAGGVDLALLDPPRAGAREVLPLVAAKRPRRIVYCSCHPATLARDAADLAQRGYRLTAAGVVDMFPHTAHVEAMALFETE